MNDKIEALRGKLDFHVWHGKVHIRPSEANVLRILSNDPRWAGCIRRDETTRMIMLYDPPWGEDERPAVMKPWWEPSDGTRLCSWLSRIWQVHVPSTIVRRAVDVVADANSFNWPLRRADDSWEKKITRWILEQGEERMRLTAGEVATTVLGIERPSQMIVRRVGKTLHNLGWISCWRYDAEGKRRAWHPPSGIVRQYERTLGPTPIEVVGREELMARYPVLTESAPDIIRKEELMITPTTMLDWIPKSCPPR